MNNVNLIQSKIMQLEGGAFQKLFDSYLYKKYKFKNIQTLGVQTGTNKPTKGTPDSYVLTDDEKYILINYGTVSLQSVEKIKADILSCFDKSKLILPSNKIKKSFVGIVRQIFILNSLARLGSLLMELRLNLLELIRFRMIWLGFIRI